MKIIRVPKDNTSDNYVRVVSIKTNHGEDVHSGQIICECETSKTVFEIESSGDGFAYFLIEEGEDVPVGNAICIITKEKKSQSQIGDIKQNLLGKSENSSEKSKIVTKRAKILIERYKLGLGVFEEKIITEEMVKSYLNGLSALNVNYSFKDNDILIFGLGGHANMCIDILKKTTEFNLVGFIDDNPEVDNSHGLKYFGNFTNIDYLISKGLKNIVIGIGFISNLKKREEIFLKLEPKLNIPSLIHNSAIIEPSASIGIGCQIMAGSIIGSNVTVKNNCIINSGAIISHDSFIDRSSHVTPGACIAGNVKIGKRTTIGMCSTIYIGLSIGDDVVINNNESVVNDMNGKK